jgi:hypothetical protein
VFVVVGCLLPSLTCLPSGWMILYILAIPLFSFVLPVVSFWQMDDFSW